MKLYTTDKKVYDVVAVELWTDREYVFTAETKDGELIALALDEFDKVEE